MNGTRNVLAILVISWVFVLLPPVFAIPPKNNVVGPNARIVRRPSLSPGLSLTVADLGQTRNVLNYLTVRQQERINQQTISSLSQLQRAVTQTNRQVTQRAAEQEAIRETGTRAGFTTHAPYFGLDQRRTRR